MYADRDPPQRPPCSNCRVELLPENSDAANIYSVVKGQVIVAGMGQVIGLNQLAVWEAIDRFQVINKLDCFEKVVGTFNHILAKEKEEASA